MRYALWEMNNVCFCVSNTTYDVNFYEIYNLGYYLFFKVRKVGFDNVICAIVGMFVIEDSFTLRCGAVTIMLLWRM